MAVDPKVAELIKAMEKAFPPPEPTMTADDMRAIIKKGGHVINVDQEAVGSVENRTVPTPLGGTAIRIYRPLGAGSGGGDNGDSGDSDRVLPVLMFFHGGGWVVCDLDSHDDLCRALTNASGCVVIAVDYHLAPEHPFPQPLEDCYAVTTWVAEHAAELGVDASRLAVFGDSAGGNLAASVCLMARDKGGPAIAFQVLVYPVINHDFTTFSHQNPNEGYFLKTDEVQWYWRQYLQDEADAADPYASPLRADDHSGLPPALIVTAENDPLRDEGEAYGAALRAAGVEATVSRYDGMFHSFFSFLQDLPAAQEAKLEIGAALRQALQVTA